MDITKFNAKLLPDERRVSDVVHAGLFLAKHAETLVGKPILESCSAKAIGEKAEVTDAHEASGKHVQKEAPQELRRAQGHLAVFAAVGVILPAKGDALLVEGQQAMIGDRHAMGVATEIAQHLQGTTEGGLGIDDPVVTVQAADEFGELLWIGQSGGGTSAAELVAAVQTFEASQELAAKDAAENLPR